eukprot:7583139-Prorocentrum_lima.AAC.1
MLTLLSLQPGGIEWNAPECKSWVLICRAITQRSNLNGRDTALLCVPRANETIVKLTLKF